MASISIVQLAQLLGISKTTVHAALTGSAPVKDETRARVLAAAEAHGYRPNLLAQALRTKRTELIGVLAYDAFTNMMSECLHEVALEATKHGYRTLSAGTYADLHREREMLELYLSIGVQGILLYPVPAPDNVPLLTHVAQRIPLVLLEHQLPGLSVDIVGVDHRDTGKRAAQHLLAGGRRHLAILRPSSAHAQDRWVSERQAGYTEAVQAAGLPSAIAIGGHQPMTMTYEQSAYADMTDFLASGRRCDGLLAVNDHLAYGAIAALKAAGLQVPDDVAVIGCDDLPTNATCTPPLTSLRAPMPAVGTEAIRLLARRMANETTEFAAQQVVLPSELNVRASSGVRP
jgi:DNA-binding LacI/PurR family transcriptional regulator